MEESLGPPKGIIIYIPHLTLLIATVNSLIKELAGSVKFASNYGDLIMEISQGELLYFLPFNSIEYIATVAAEANKICLNDGKKTIAPDHVFRALKVESFIKMALIN